MARNEHENGTHWNRRSVKNLIFSHPLKCIDNKQENHVATVGFRCPCHDSASAFFDLCCFWNIYLWNVYPFTITVYSNACFLNLNWIVFQKSHFFQPLFVLPCFKLCWCSRLTRSLAIFRETEGQDLKGETGQSRPLLTDDCVSSGLSLRQTAFSRILK